MIILGTNSIKATGFDVANSCRFNDGSSDYLTRTPSSSGNRDKYTLSFWFKRSGIGTVQKFFNAKVDGSNFTEFGFESSDVMQIYNYNSGSVRMLRETNRVFRDVSAWYHLVLKYDSSQSTASDRFKIYINGVEETSFSSSTEPALNEDSNLNVSSAVNTLGRSQGDTYYFDGYMAEVVLLDGTALAADSFGEFDSDSGIWKPIDLSNVTFGTYGYWLKNETSNQMYNDSSGSSRNFARWDATIYQSTDTPTNNFCTLNPLVNFKYTTNGITEGGTTFGDNTGGGIGGAFGTMAVTSGKWYWEMKLVQQVAHYIGVSAYPDDGDRIDNHSDPHQINSSFVYNISGARIEYIDGGSVTAGSADAFTDFHTAGDIMSIALNMDDNQISIYGNGTLQADVANTSLFDAANKMVVPFHATINDECQYNFGGYSVWTPSSAASDANGYGTFEYAPPSGYYALCTKNLAEYG